MDAAWSPAPVWPGAPDPVIGPALAGISQPGWPSAQGTPGGPDAVDNPAFVSLPPPAAERPARRPPAALIVGAAVAVIVIAAVGLFWSSRRPSSHVTAAGAPVPAISVSESASPENVEDIAPSTTGAVSGGASSPTAGAEAGVEPFLDLGTDAVQDSTTADDDVESLDRLLDRSAAARGDVASTAAALQSCRVPATTAEATFRRARDDRNQLASEATALTTSTGADQQVRDAIRGFIALQKASAQADDAFADWSSEVAAAGCSDHAVHTANWDLANRYSGDASAAKVRFVDLWNPIAAEHGLSPRSADVI